ncbi:unnamed protein product, partial [Ascophyllum nodosum]
IHLPLHFQPRKGKRQPECEKRHAVVVKKTRIYSGVYIYNPRTDPTRLARQCHPKGTPQRGWQRSLAGH